MAFGVAMAVESLGNHLLFRTYGLDLGIYAQTAYDFAHLRVNDGTMFHWEPFNQLGDHFDLLPALPAPLTWVVRADWLLLAVQILAVLVGAWGTLSSITRHHRARGAVIAGHGADAVPVRCVARLGLRLPQRGVVAACRLPWLLPPVRRWQAWCSNSGAGAYVVDQRNRGAMDVLCVGSAAVGL